jgi:hypothetical protein
MASHSESVHRRLASQFSEQLYFRFDVAKGLEDVTLSDWKKSSKISGHTIGYLSEPSVIRSVRQCAGILAQG